MLYYKTALTCATLTAGWEKDVTKCIDVVKLAQRLSHGKLLFSQCCYSFSVMNLFGLSCYCKLTCVISEPITAG